MPKPKFLVFVMAALLIAALTLPAGPVLAQEPPDQQNGELHYKGE